MALGTLEGVGNEAVSSNFKLLNFAFRGLSSKSVRQIKNRIRANSRGPTTTYVRVSAGPIAIVAFVLDLGKLRMGCL